MDAPTKTAPNQTNRDLLDLAYQYMSDLRRPPVGDSVVRRLAWAEKVIREAGAKL